MVQNERTDVLMNFLFQNSTALQVGPFLPKHCFAAAAEAVADVDSPNPSKRH